MFNKSSETIIQVIKQELFKSIANQDELVSSISADIQKINIQVDKTKDPKFGDYASNVMMLLGLERDDCVRWAKIVGDALSKKIFAKVDVVNPGFINMTIKHSYKVKVIDEILKGADNYGNFKSKKLFYNIEFISANPTGLLHIGHARNGAIGDSLARIWKAYGIDVNREYYINDGGGQINRLGMSTLVRYKQALGRSFELPEDSYHGEEIIEVAGKIKSEIGEKYANVEFDKDTIINNDEAQAYFNTFSKNYMLEIIKKTLDVFGVKMDIWFPESKIYEQNLIPVTLKELDINVYEKDGATWLKTTSLGDDKDRVLIKSDGTFTYFMPDIAYHNIKLSRGYNKIFNIWGSDHKSYADRMSIAVQLLGHKKEELVVLIMQMVRLVKNGEEFKMSKRSGISLTLQDLLDTVGKDAARWYLVSQALSTHLEIDVDKATSQSSDNPLYYVQYAHARINQLKSKAHIYSWPKNYDLLNKNENELLNMLQYYKHTVEMVATNYEVHKMSLYLTNLAKAFHSYYANNKVIDETNLPLTEQRLQLVLAVKQVIKNGLALLGITATDQM